jgi:uncharacterized protein (DUF736 family)
MIIGHFQTTDDGYTGVIKTLTFTTEAVFEPAERKSEQSPDYRVTNGETEIGAAWKKTSRASTEYLSVQLDGPALPTAIECALFKTGTESGHTLVWERPRKRR